MPENGIFAVKFGKYQPIEGAGAQVLLHSRPPI